MADAPIDDTPDDPVRRATASCGVCPWTAIIRGDTDEEIFEFLRLLLADHLTTMHTRTHGTTDGPVVVD